MQTFSFKKMQLSIVCNLVAILFRPQYINSLAHVRYGVNFKPIVFKSIIQYSGWGTRCENALKSREKL